MASAVPTALQLAHVVDTVVLGSRTDLATAPLDLPAEPVTQTNDVHGLAATIVQLYSVISVPVLATVLPVPELVARQCL